MMTVIEDATSVIGREMLVSAPERMNGAAIATIITNIENQNVGVDKGLTDKIKL